MKALLLAPGQAQIEDPLVSSIPLIAKFEFATDRKIIFGSGSFAQAGELAAEFGQRVFVVHGRSATRTEGLRHQLQERGLEISATQVIGEPSIEQVHTAVAAARAFQAELVIGFGGGSVLDLAKAVAALVPAPGQVLDYVEIIGRGQALTKAGLPCLAIPTTAGTGSEVTRNAVLAVKEKGLKVSLRSPNLLPAVALVDPELTCSLPKEITAFTGLDALTQVIEPYLSKRANPLVDALCREAIGRAGRSLEAAYHQSTQLSHREDMAVVSLFGGLALANAGLGAVHGLASPLGGMFPAPHGAICAALLPSSLRVNLQALRERAPESPVLQRFDDVGRWLTNSPDAKAESGLEWISALCRSLEIPRLSSYGMKSTDLPEVVKRGLNASSMKGNPIELTAEELTTVLTAAL
jgi:alcohol dehydrogenase class IV